MMIQVAPQDTQIAEEELVGSPEALEAAAIEAGTFEQADDPQAIGTIVWTVRTARARC